MYKYYAYPAFHLWKIRQSLKLGHARVRFNLILKYNRRSSKLNVLPPFCLQLTASFLENSDLRRERGIRRINIHFSSILGRVREQFQKLSWKPFMVREDGMTRVHNCDGWLVWDAQTTLDVARARTYLIHLSPTGNKKIELLHTTLNYEQASRVSRDLRKCRI